MKSRIKRMTGLVTTVLLLSNANAAEFHVLSGTVCIAGSNRCFESGGREALFEADEDDILLVPEGDGPNSVDTEIGFQNRRGQIKYERLAGNGRYMVASFTDMAEKPLSIAEFVQRFISGNRETVQGTKLNKPQAATLASMPKGYVLLPASAWDLLLRELPTHAAVEQIAIVDVASGRSLAGIQLSSEGAVPVLTIPEHALVAGGEYEWSIQVAGEKYSDLFRVLNNNEQEEVEVELLQLEAAHCSTACMLMMEASIYQYFGLSFNRDQVFDKVRATTE